MRRFLSVLLAFGVTTSIQGCLLPDSGSTDGTAIDILPEAPPPDLNTYVCNPLDGETNSQAREQGIKGRLYYLDSTQPHYSQVADYFTYGHEVEGIDLFFNQIFIPTRPFDRGFMTASGTTIQTPEGNTLYEYFAIHHEGRLQLGNASAGAYQLAILSDDGAVMSMDYGSGMQTLINNDGVHATKMKCATEPIYLNAGEKIPYNLDYYQGPRYHISLILLWRPWTGDFSDPACDKSGNSYFFDSTQDPPAPKANYNALLTRGWSPVPPESFVLPQTSAPNPCNEPAPNISNFRVTTIASNSVTLAWDTDRPATSQVIYHLVNGSDQITTNTGVLVTTHSVQVTGLSANTEYRLRAASASSSGLSTESAELAVRTRR